MLNSRGGGMHHSLFSPSLTSTCIKSECPAQARMGGGGGGSGREVQGFQMTGA